MGANWTKYWTRNYTYHYSEVCLNTFASRLENLGLPSVRNSFYLTKEGNVIFFSKKKDREKFVNACMKKYALNTKNLKKLISDIILVAEKYLKSGSVSPEDLSDKELLDVLKRYYDNFLTYTMYFWIIWNSGENYSNKIAENFSKKYGGDKKFLSKLITYLSTPTKKSSVLLLYEEIKEKKTNIKDLYEKYKWMPHNDLHSKPWTIEDVKKYVENHKISKVEKIEAHYKMPMDVEFAYDNKEELFILQARPITTL